MPLELIVHNFAQFLYVLLIIPVLLFSIIFYGLAFSYTRRSRLKKARSLNVKTWPDVTIQIPTKNEIVALRCAKKCLDFDYPSDKFEIIIGDDSTKAEVSRKIDEFAKKYPKIKVTRRHTNFGFKPGNLNHMLDFSSGEIIIIFDSDFVPDRDFLKKIVSPFVADKKVACVQARWDYINLNQNRTSKFASALLMVYHHMIAPINEKLGVSLLFGSGEAVRASVLRGLGGWKNWAMTEDVEFSLRVLKNGYKTVYLEDVVVKGEVPFTVTGLSKQQKRWSYGNTRAFFDNIRWILFSRRFSPSQKFFLFLTLLGYVSAPLIVLFIILGAIVWFSGTPGTINMSLFMSETAKILLVNSGFLFATVVVLLKRGMRNIMLSVVGTSLTVGLWVAISVFDGFLKAIRNQKMHWYLITKTGNIQIAKDKVFR